MPSHILFSMLEDRPTKGEKKFPIGGLDARQKAAKVGEQNNRFQFLEVWNSFVCASKFSCIRMCHKGPFLTHCPTWLTDSDYAELKH